MKTTRKIMILAVISAILFTLANLVSGWTAADPGYDIEYARSDRGILPEFVVGNTPGTVTGFTVFKQDYGKDGFQLGAQTEPVLFILHPDPMDPTHILRVWLAYNEDHKTYVYRWESVGIVVNYFMVKGGDNFFVYSYDGTFVYDGGLFSPRVGGEDKNIADISHIDLVFSQIPVVTTTEGTTTETTTTEATTTTTGTTTTEATTTTTGTTPEGTTVTETTETTTEATTSGETTTGTTPLNETVTETTTGTAPLEATVTATSTINLVDDEIPLTGESAGQTALIGIILMALAASLLVIVRRSQKKIN